METTQQRSVVLVIDDEPGIVELLTEILQDKFKVHAATNAQTALQYLASEPVDVIISDQRMPDYSGVELLKKSIELSPESERILITAYADLQNVIQSINEAKVSYYLTKPIDPQQIKLVAGQAAEITRLRRDNSSLMHKLQNTNTMLEEKVAERSAQLQNANEELRALQKTREEVYNIATHDLKNPISVIQLTLREISKLNNDPTIAEFIDLGEESCENLQSIVMDMLSVATLNAGGRALHKQEFPADELLLSSMAAFKPTAANKNITLDTKISQSLPVLHADERKLREALDNLVSNAIKYTPRGGRVTLQGAQINGSLCITVSDSGLGMTEKDILNAFGEFRKLSATPTDGETSTGLGLFIVKKIIDLHGGDITISSPGPNKGTTITVTLPLNQVKDQ